MTNFKHTRNQLKGVGKGFKKIGKAATLTAHQFKKLNKALAKDAQASKVWSDYHDKRSRRKRK